MRSQNLIASHSSKYLGLVSDFFLALLETTPSACDTPFAANKFRGYMQRPILDVSETAIDILWSGSGKVSTFDPLALLESSHDTKDL